MSWTLLAQSNSSEPDWSWLFRGLVFLGAVVVLAVIIWAARRAMARSRAAVLRAGTDEEVRSARRQLAITSALTYTVRVAAWTTLVFLVLVLLGVNLTALVAGAGFVGAGLAFGAQNVVKDYLAGFYVVVEDQYAVGDTVELGLVGGGTATVSGVVEDLTFRRTAIRRNEGSVISIGNGSVIFAQNLSRGAGRLVVRATVPLSGTVQETRADLEVLTEALRNDPAVTALVRSGPVAAGVEPAGRNEVTLVVSADVAASQRLDAGDLIRARMNARFLPLASDAPLHEPE
jgi:moderate conductance mechanosensitive channel